jgi:hypothetical protein
MILPVKVIHLAIADGEMMVVLNHGITVYRLVMRVVNIISKTMDHVVVAQLIWQLE